MTDNPQPPQPEPGQWVTVLRELLRLVEQHEIPGWRIGETPEVTTAINNAKAVLAAAPPPPAEPAMTQPGEYHPRNEAPDGWAELVRYHAYVVNVASDLQRWADGRKFAGPVKRAIEQLRQPPDALCNDEGDGTHPNQMGPWT